MLSMFRASWTLPQIHSLAAHWSAIAVSLDLEQGSTNQVTIVPPPGSAEDEALTASAEGREECTEAESEDVTEVAAAPEQEDITEANDQQEPGPEEATEAEFTENSNGEDNNDQAETGTNQVRASFFLIKRLSY